MRIFVALDLDEPIRKRIEQFVEEMCALAPHVRWVAPQSLHVTLKFIGEKPDSTVKQVEELLASVPSDAFKLHFRGAGFFPTAKAARVFWIGIEAEAGLAKLAKSVEMVLAGIGMPEETRTFSPHLTLARASGGSGAPGLRNEDRANRKFARLQEKLEQSPAPDFGTMTAGEFFLYGSQLSGGGSRYTKLARFGLGSPEQ